MPLLDTWRALSSVAVCFDEQKHMSEQQCMQVHVVYTKGHEGIFVTFMLMKISEVGSLFSGCGNYIKCLNEQSIYRRSINEPNEEHTTQYECLTIN